MKIRLLFFLLLPLAIIGCDTHSSTNDTHFTIYTSIYPIQYISQEIAGDDVLVKSIYPPGVDAHTYEPSTRDLTSIANSDAFIYLGAGMEGFAETAVKALQSHDVAFIELGQNTDLFHTIDEQDHEHEHDGHDHGDYDPHIWLDPLRMIEIAEMIQDELTEINPKQRTLYEENFKALKEKMLKLDQDFKDTLLSKTNKHIIVAHAAYGYWEERYGIEQIPISGLSTGSEPSQKDLTEIVEQAKELNLTYVIFEQNSSDRVSAIIQEYIKAEALEIHNLETLTDKDINNNEDYISLMKQNLTILDQVTD